MDKNLKDVGEQFQEQGKKILDNIGNLINKSPETQLVEIIILSECCLANGRGVEPLLVTDVEPVPVQFNFQWNLDKIL